MFIARLIRLHEFKVFGLTLKKSLGVTTGLKIRFHCRPQDGIVKELKIFQAIDLANFRIKDNQVIPIKYCLQAFHSLPLIGVC